MEVLARWDEEREGCAIVIGLPAEIREHVGERTGTSLRELQQEGVAIVYPSDVSTAVEYVSDIVDAQPAQGAAAVDEVGPDVPFDMTLLDDGFALGPMPAEEWREALKKHGSGS